MYLVISATRPSVTVHLPDTPKQVLRKRETEMLEPSCRAEFRGAVPGERAVGSGSKAACNPVPGAGWKLANSGVSASADWGLSGWNDMEVTSGLL